VVARITSNDEILGSIPSEGKIFGTIFKFYLLMCDFNSFLDKKHFNTQNFLVFLLIITVLALSRYLVFYIRNFGENIYRVPLLKLAKVAQQDVRTHFTEKAKRL